MSHSFSRSKRNFRKILLYKVSRIEGEIIINIKDILTLIRYGDRKLVLTPFWTASLKMSRDYGAQFFTLGDEIILSTQLSNKYLACVINMIA